jgi:hypothetical protein
MSVAAKNALAKLRKSGYERVFERNQAIAAVLHKEALYAEVYIHR